MQISHVKGATFTILDSMAAAAFTALEIRSWNHTGLTRDEINMTHYGSADFLEIKPSARADGGSVQLEVNVDPEDIGNVVSMITDDELYSCLYTFPISPGSGNTTNATIAFDGFMKNHGMNLPADGGVTATMEIRLSDNIVYTPESA